MNFFAALDDSGDEAEPQISVPKKETKKPPKATESSKSSDRRRQPGDRNTKGGRGGRAPSRDGKRAYDRRSGTGRGKEIKKGGGGARNWGSDKNEARKSEGAVTEGQEDAQLKEDVASPTEEKEPEPQEEDKTLSYEEFLANKQKPKSELFADKEVRKVENEFANLTPKVAEEEDFLVMGGGKHKRARDKKDTKKTVDVGFKVATPNTGDDRRSSRDRRDGDRRGSGRGGGGRGSRRDSRGRSSGSSGGRGRGSQKAKVVNVADTEAFPSL